MHRTEIHPDIIDIIKQKRGGKLSWCLTATRPITMSHNASLSSLSITFADLLTTDEVIKALGVVHG